MNNLSAKNKIYMLVVGWFVCCVLVFMYGFSFLDNSNESLVTKHADQQKKLAMLQAEIESYKQAQVELDKVAKQKYRPDDLFSQDVSLVNELKNLEDLAKMHNVGLVIGGLSGTLRNAQKAKTQSEVFTVPYSLYVTGSYQDVAAFLENIEHLRFITTVNSVSITSLSNNDIAMNLTALFYLRK